MTKISRGSLEGIWKESTVTGRPQPSCMRCKAELEREFVGSAHVCCRQAGMWQTPLKSLNAYRHRSPRLTTCALSEESQVQNGPPSLTLCPLTRADALLARIYALPLQLRTHRLSQWDRFALWGKCAASMCCVKFCKNSASSCNAAGSVSGPVAFTNAKPQLTLGASTATANNASPMKKPR